MRKLLSNTLMKWNPSLLFRNSLQQAKSWAKKKTALSVSHFSLFQMEWKWQLNLQSSKKMKSSSTLMQKAVWLRSKMKMLQTLSSKLLLFKNWDSVHTRILIWPNISKVNKLIITLISIHTIAVFRSNLLLATLQQQWKSFIWVSLTRL